MHLKAPALVAMHLFLAALAENSDCYNQGEKFSNLGDDNDISDAFNRICDRIGGKEYQIGQRISDCENVGGHRVDVSIKVKEDSYARGNLFTLGKSDCSNYLSIITECKHGGYLDVEIIGSHHAKAAVMVDPQQAQC